MKRINKVEFINQSPIGKSSRSNPVTYVKAYDYIRDLFSSQQMSKIRGYQPKHFSFNVEGGRCEACKGEGEQVVEMQFLADVHLECESCKGRRFRSEILEVEFKGKNIFDVLSLSVLTVSSRCSMSASDMCNWGSPPARCRAERRSASNWHLS